MWPTDAVSVGPISTLFSHGCDIVLHSLSSCTVRFPSCWLSIPSPRPHTRPSSPLLFFSWEHGRPHASHVEQTPSPLFPPPLTYAGSAPWPTLSPQCEPAVSPIHVISTFSALHPTSIRHYKMPLVLALFLCPHPLESEAELRDPVVIHGTRFIS